MDRVRPSGRVPAPVRVSSSPHPNTNLVPCLPPRISSISGAPSGDREDAGQRSAGDRSRSGPRLLQPPLPGGKGDGWLAPCDRPVDSEHLHSTDTVQDGDCSLRLERCPGERSPRLPGLEGRVLSSARPSKFQEVSALCVTGDSVPVQGSLLRTVHCPPSLHESVRSCVSVGALSRDSASPLLGRLAGSGLLGDQSPSARPRPALVVSRSGDRGQQGEVGSHALTFCELSRDDDRHSGGQGFSLESESGEVPSPGGQLCKDELPPARQWEVLLGHLSSLEKLVPRGRLRLRSKQWQLKTSWSPEDDPPDLPVELTQEIRDDLSWWTVKSCLLQGVPFGTLPPGLLLFTDASCAGWGAHLLDQRASGKWSEEEQMLHINLLEMKAVWLGLQSFQKIVTGHRVTVMCDNSTVVAYVSKQGGTHSRSMCELTSRLLKWTEDIDVHLEARYLPGQNNILADLLSRRDQAIATEWTLHRQVAKVLLSSWGSPSIDLFASRLNAQLPVYCSLVPDDQAALEDAFRHPWDNLDVYAFPPFALLGKVLSRVRQSRNCSMTLVSLGRQGLVRGSTAPADASTSRSASVGRRRSPAPQRSTPPKRPRVETSHVATVKQLLRKSGFSRGAASDMSRCVRESTSNVYQSKWLAFCNWCRGRGVAPVSASVPLIVDFFRHLVRDKGLSVPAVRGYRASLNSVFALKGRDLAASREVSMLFRSFSKTARPEWLRPPNWDVSLVLQSLTRAPYEPLRSADERFLAQKTLVLIALASAKRIGELHALSYRVSHSRAWGEVSFVFVPGFVAKTQDPSSQDPRFDSFTIPALPKARDNPNGRLLCPVREVKLYLRRTAPHRPACERLFLTTGPNPKEIAKNTISFWLRKTIARAYELAGRSLPVPAPRARETRGIAPSLLYRKNFALPQVLSAGTWRRHTTFTRHYLRDLAHKSLDTYHLGPVVAAQALV